MSREEEIKDGLYDHTLEGEAAEVIALTEEGIALGMDPLDILFDALIPSLQEVGRLFEIGEYFVPEMLVAARAMQGAMAILRPLLADKGAEPIGKVVMLTVKGDVHDIGKNLCNIMLEGEGFEIVDLGVNVKPEDVVEAVKEHQPQLLGFSAFLTTTMPFFKSNITALKEADLRDNIRIMVGGAPVTQEFADSVGADGFAPDASAAVRLAKKLMVDMGYDVTMGGDSSEGESALANAVQAVEDLLVKAGQGEDE
ncbi:MAG: corrinoid protein [Chloroflexota bacterium]